VGRIRARRHLDEGAFIETVLQDRGDGLVREGLDGERASARALQSLGAVTLLESQDSERGTEPLFGVRSARQQGLDELGRRGPSLLGPVHDATGRPLCVAAVAARHVGRFGDRNTLLVTAFVAGHATVLCEDLHHVRAGAHVEDAAHQTVGDAVEIAIDRQVVR